MGAAKTGRRVRPQDFYGGGFSKAEKEAIEVARQMEGLAEEAAMLRVKLRTAINQENVDIRLIKYGTDALVKVVAAQYRLSPKSKKDLAESLAGTMNIIADFILPADRWSANFRTFVLKLTIRVLTG